MPNQHLPLSRRRPSKSLPLACAVAFGMIQSAVAVDRTWLGTTDSNWSTSTNWSPSGTMSSGDTAVLDGTATAGRSPDQNTGVSFEKILFKGTAGQAYSPGFGSWTVAGSSTTTFIEVESGNDYVNHVNPDRGSGPLITLKSGNNTILNNGGGSLTVSSSSTFAGNVLRANGSGASTLIVDGSGTTYLATASNPFFKLADNGSNVLSLTKIGAGNLHLETANTYSGLTTVTTGVLRITNGDALGATGTTSRTEISGNENTGRLELSGSITTGETFRIGMRQNAALDAPALSNFSGNNTVTGDIQGVTGGSRINIESQADLLTLAGNLSQTSGTGSRTWQLMGAGDGLVSGVISNGTATLALIKKGAGTWTFSNTNTYTGTTNVNEGTLVINGNNSGATGNVTVASGATLGGTGTVGGATTITGTHAAGNNGVGMQSFSSTLTYAANSIFEWDLSQSSTSTGFDTVSATGNINVNTTGTVFKVVLGGTALTDIVNTGNAFWNTPYGTQTWNMSDIFGKAFSSGAFQSVDTSTDVTAYGSFTINGTSLTWTAVPEPTSALAGILLGAGLLRRRRTLA